MSEHLMRLLRRMGVQSHHSLAALSSSSEVFLSLNVMGPTVKHYTRRHPPLTRHTAKVLIRVSIGMFLALLLTFLVVYTVILIYVDKHFHPPLSKSQSAFRKLRLKGRFAAMIGPKDVKYLEILSSQNNDLSLLLDESDMKEFKRDRKPVWNPNTYYGVNESLPQCKWQTLFRVLIISAPHRSEQRQAIRSTWCDPTNFPQVPQHAWHCVFLVGQSENHHLNLLLKEEKAGFGDLLIGSFWDSYKNLTLKVVPGLLWSVNNCPSSFLVKTDDDCFVNVGLLHTFLLHHNQLKTGLYAGNFVLDRSKLRVMREKKNRWSVSYKDFPSKYYPPYASGMGYILSSDVAHQLVAESHFVPPIPVEDAYVGIVLSRLWVQPTNSKRFQISAAGLSLCNFLYVFIVHDVTREDQTELLHKARNASVSCNHSVLTDWF
ncbi:beta-1,3-galactosyltransferase 1-like [Plakobranchus ocellatus]|uniref:Hexosyltransferase n=1 Tax=Plakobranchus ocellatus TaxID=259542 RepID=A0AAV4BKK7_9GAST|nr:beta-1,3-galactosyltransferase 1-like [Plakobranchus ocellatus]